MWQIFVGFDHREVGAFLVTVASIRRHLSAPIQINMLELTALQAAGLYTRPTEVRDGRLYDVLSDHPMSTEFAVSRFLVPCLARRGWALFLDCDMLARADLNELFAAADPRYAVMCVKHDHRPNAETKMDGQVQSAYPRKNWSSATLFNCDHPANQRLTLDLVNTARGRDLHAFCWLQDDEIGELDPRCNHLVGYSSHPNPRLVHFTEGTPDMRGHESDEYADAWRHELRAIAHRLLAL